MGTAFHLETADGVPLGQQPVDARIIQGQRVQVGCDPVPLRDQGAHLGHHAKGSKAEQVDFHQTGILNRVFVPLRDHDARLGGVLQRYDLHQWLRRDQHPAHVDREVPRDADHLDCQVGEQRQVIGGWVGRRRVGCYTFQDRLTHAVQFFSRETERPRGVSHGQPRLIGNDVADQRGVLTAVAFIDVGDHLVTAIAVKIQIDVRHAVRPLAEESLKEQVMSQWIHRRDAQQISHERIGGRAATLAADATRSRLTHNVPDDQKVIRQADALDHGQLVRQLFDGSRRDRARFWRVDRHGRECRGS